MIKYQYERSQLSGIVPVYQHILSLVQYEIYDSGLLFDWDKHHIILIFSQQMWLTPMEAHVLSTVLQSRSQLHRYI